MNNLKNITPAYDSILQLKAYQGGKPMEELMREYGVSDVLKLASNENPMGYSPYATLAITEHLAELSRYPDGNAHLLKEAIADFTNTKFNQVSIGNGSNDLLDIISRTFVSNEDAIVYSQYAFIVYSMFTKMLGAKGIEVPAKRYSHDLDAMLEAVQSTANVKLVFIANPNNPTGTLLSSRQIRQFVEQVPPHVIVVIDQAYIEFAPESNNRDLIDDFNNVILVRTFSKAYGLAGMRVGYALSHPEIADLINRIRQPFNVNLLAQHAAIAALKDQDFIARVVKNNDGQKRWLCKQFDALGLAFLPSHTNFVMVNLGNAQGVYQALLEQGVIVRPLSNYDLEDWIRITVGLPEDNTRLIDTLRDTLDSL